MKKPRVIFEEYVMPHYRVPFFERLSKEVELLVVLSKDKKVDGLHDVKENLPFASVRLIEEKKGPFHPELINTIREYKPDVLISFGTALRTYTLDKNTYSAFKEMGLRTLWMGCDGYMVRNMYVEIIKNLLPWRICREIKDIIAHRKVDGFITYSNHTRRYLHITKCVPLKKIFVAQNAIDTKILSDAYKEFTKAGNTRGNNIAFAGRLSERKRVDILIKAFAEAKIPADINLLIIGEGSQEEKLKKLVTELNIENRIKFLGPIYKDEDMAKALFDASIFVMPGLGGLGFNTAMAVGLPIIYTHADGTEEDILENGINGWYFNGTVEDLKNKVEIAFSDVEKLPSMGQKSKNLITNTYNLDNMVKSYMQTIRTLI